MGTGIIPAPPVYGARPRRGKRLTATGVILPSSTAGAIALATGATGSGVANLPAAAKTGDLAVVFIQNTSKSAGGAAYLGARIGNAGQAGNQNVSQDVFKYILQPADIAAGQLPNGSAFNIQTAFYFRGCATPTTSNVKNLAGFTSFTPFTLLPGFIIVQTAIAGYLANPTPIAPTGQGLDSVYTFWDGGREACAGGMKQVSAGPASAYTSGASNYSTSATLIVNVPFA